jgi:hypothetical protein
MKRSALSDFLRSVVIAALPVAAVGCCSDYSVEVQLQVDAFAAEPDDGGLLPESVCTAMCKPPRRETIKQVYGCHVVETSDAGITGIACDEHVGHCSTFPVAGGRPPLGLRPRGAIVARDAAGAFFAQMAHVEAAAVDGFVELATALAVHGAPSSLVDDARSAAEDERRHARVAAAFARRFGAGALPPVEIDPVAAPSLETLALQNAREGCVLETYGAVVTQWQSRTAGDRAVRRAFVNIARDELRHAELAFAVARWLHARLDEAARRRVRDAQREAAAALLRDVAQPSDPRLVTTLGLPDRDAALRLVGDLRVRLWS